MRLSGDSGAIAGGVEWQPSHGSFNDSTDNLKDNGKISNGDQPDISLKVSFLLSEHVITRINRTRHH